MGQHGAIELAPTFFDAVVTSLCHEIGEVEIGDIPDDGRPEHDTKVDQEIAVFQRLMRALAPDDAETLSQLFATFARRDTHLGQAIYALDKLEAVLTLLFLEQYEHYGNIEMKPTVTERDRYFMRETGSASATDVWAAHARSCIEGFKPEITQPVLTLLDVAVRDVRGEPFAWWQKKIMPP